MLNIAGRDNDRPKSIIKMKGLKQINAKRDSMSTANLVSYLHSYWEKRF